MVKFHGFAVQLDGNPPICQCQYQPDHVSLVFLELDWIYHMEFLGGIPKSPLVSMCFNT
jgi:hypothetical protein